MFINKFFFRLIVLFTYGITNDNVNIQNVTDVNKTTIYYNMTALHPSFSYTFIIQIMDLFNNTKNENSVLFCE